MKLHEWIYEIVNEICLDREYIYPCFVRSYTAIVSNFYSSGSMSDEGKYEINGIKSDTNAVLSWSFERMVSMMGANRVKFECRMVDKKSAEILKVSENSFDIRTGESVL